MRAYSQNLRQQVLRAVDEGNARAQIIERFQVSRATIKRYVKQRRETGNVMQRPIPGRPPRIGTALQMGVQELLEAHPDASQNDYCHWWDARRDTSKRRKRNRPTGSRAEWLYHSSPGTVTCL